MSFLPPPPDPSRNLGFLLQLENLRRSREDDRSVQENREFNQLLKLAEAGVPVRDLAGIAPNISATKFRAAEAIGKAAQTRIKQQEQTRQAQQELAQQQAATAQAAPLAPLLAQQIEAGQPPGAALLGQIEQLGPVGEQALRGLVSQEQAELRTAERARVEGRGFRERTASLIDAEFGGDIEAFRAEFPQQARFFESSIRRDEAEAARGSDLFESPRVSALLDRRESAVTLQDAINTIEDAINRSRDIAGFRGTVQRGLREAGRVIQDFGLSESVRSTAELMGQTELEGDLADRVNNIAVKDDVTMGDLVEMVALLSARAFESGRLSDQDIERQRAFVGRGFTSAARQREAFRQMSRRNARNLNRLERRMSVFVRNPDQRKELEDFFRATGPVSGSDIGAPSTSPKSLDELEAELGIR